MSKFYRRPKIREHLVQKPATPESWDVISERILDEVQNGVLTAAEGHEKLCNYFDKRWHADPDGDYMAAFGALEEFEKTNTFKSLNVHSNVYEDFVKIAKEDNRSIASTVALMTKEYRYARREKRKVDEQLRELYEMKMDEVFKTST